MLKTIILAAFGALFALSVQAADQEITITRDGAGVVSSGGTTPVQGAVTETEAQDFGAAFSEPEEFDCPKELRIAQVHVDGYYSRDGTYVAPHYRSRPDNTYDNNWSTRGNINPYTGSRGTRTPPSGLRLGIPSRRASPPRRSKFGGSVYRP